ncbi:MAG: hypothetical protein LQ350_001115 [Teloschistes chrysophthalmus]|nr:MAG: hypothetical protein LQ350_001115 [Niorma chrysophthalma]
MIEGPTNSVTTSTDQDGSRRKRQRTDSPAAESDGVGHETAQSGVEQFMAAANAEPSAFEKATISNLEGVASKEESCVVNTGEATDHTINEHQGLLDAVPPHDSLSMAAQLPLHQRKKRRKSPKRKRKLASAVPSNPPAAPATEGHVGMTADGAFPGTPKPETDVLPVEETKPAPKMIDMRPDGKLSSPKKSRQRLQSSHEPENSRSIEKIMQGGTRQMIGIRPDGKLVAPRSQKSEIEEVVTEGPARISTDVQAIVASTTTTSTVTTPPKKLMKIRSNGKLASPTNQAPTKAAPIKRRGRSKKQSATIKPGVVIMRYGSTDETRLSVGMLVQEILSRPTVLEHSESKSDAVRRTPEAPKATHPFFSGKPAQKTRVESPKRHPDTSTADGQQSESSLVSNKSPKKRGTNVAPSSWASFGAPGRSSLGSSGTHAFRGAVDPMWPPQGMVHILPESDTEFENQLLHGNSSLAHFKPSAAAKLKTSEAKIVEREEVLHRYATFVNAWRTTATNSALEPSQHRILRVPRRSVLRGQELQDAYAKVQGSQSGSQGDLNESEAENVDELGEDFNHSHHNHPAVNHLYDSLKTSQSAFDRFECEPHTWSHKYAPKEANEVLQPGREAVILKDWLRSLAVNSIDHGTRNDSKIQDASKASKKLSAGLQKKKRKRAEELDGFVVSSDEEANEMDELHDTHNGPFGPQDPDSRRTELRVREAANLSTKSEDGEKVTNAIVISGPHGCGKTAAVYAVTQELGFEVFEINPSSRRSGKDILDKVGDMSRNHLVTHGQTDDSEKTDVPDGDSLIDSEALRQDIETGRQSTMAAFLQPTKKQGKASKKQKRTNDGGAEVKKAKQRTQKQSVILLEEVDVLFEEDKQFWATIMELIVQSRRPIVMTCTDEWLLPLADLPLFGILRFMRPPQPLAIKYLSLVACSEGHLLSREAVSALYTASNSDLRASITQLQFFCQMGIGDTKGGLDWMLIPSSTMPEQDIRDKRVVSEGTYLKGMDFIGHKHEPPVSEQEMDCQIDIILAFHRDWSIDLAEKDSCLPATASTMSPSDDRKSNYQELEVLDLVYDAFSAADVHQYTAFRGPLHSPLDVSAPKISAKDHANFIEGPTVLEADAFEDHSGTSDSIAAALRVSARQCFLATTTNSDQSPQPLTEQYLITTLPPTLQTHRRRNPVTPKTLSTAFAPLTKPSKPSTLSLKPPFISTLDSSPTSTITKDIAPYIRLIVAYDLRLEEQRRLLDLAGGGGGGRNGKRTRTTRASRAALEGGSKRDTRRERWFPKALGFERVLGTGGRGWVDVALKRASVEGGGGDGDGDGGGVPSMSQETAGSVEEKVRGEENVD